MPANLDIELTKRVPIHGYVIVDLITLRPIMRGTDYLECLKEQQLQAILNPSMKISLVPCAKETYDAAEVPTIEL